MTDERTPREIAAEDQKTLGVGFVWRQPGGNETHIPAEQLVIFTDQFKAGTLADVRLKAADICARSLSVSDAPFGLKRGLTLDELKEYADKLVAWAIRGV